MEIKGRLVQILPAQTGQGRNGEWKKQDFVIELEGTYPRKACFTVWGDKINIASLVEGTLLNVFFDIESREYQGKWFTNLTAWKAETADGSHQSSAPPLPPMEVYQPEMDIPPMPDNPPF